MFEPYNPYGYGMGMNSPYMPPQQPVRPATQGGPDWIQVPSIKQVEQVNVQPGGKAWVMVQNEPVFALRTADNMGLVTTDYYRFEKYNPEAVSAPAPEYVTRKEFDDFVRSLSTPRNPRAKKEEASE